MFGIKATLTSDHGGHEIELMAPQILAEREDLKEAVDFFVGALSAIDDPSGQVRGPFEIARALRRSA